MPVAVLRAGDERIAPLVCVHPVTGRVDAYRPLAQTLAYRGPVLGLDVEDPAVGSFGELAARHAGELAPRGPVVLVGWAMGGVIAAELARTILARGGEVAFLGLLDSRAPVPEMRARPTDRLTLARFFVYQSALTREQAPPAAPASGDAATVLAALREAGVADDLDEAELERRLAIFIALTRAFFVHEQRAIPMPIHLFESTDAHPSHPKPPTLGWEPLTPRLERQLVAGTHFTLLAPGHVDALARAIERVLP